MFIIDMARFNYSEQDMENAIKSVKNGSPIATAAKNFKVPRTTLSDKCKGKTPICRKMGPASILSTEEEASLVKWIIHLGSRGFPVTTFQLLDSVKMLMTNLGKHNPFTNGRPGRHWLEAFKKRHPQICIRISQNLTKTRASVSETNIRRWFEEILEYFTQQNLHDTITDPSRIFNCDETAFFLSPGNNRVLVKKGQKSVHNIINSDEKENITTLIMGNAAGEVAPPMIVVKLKRVPASLATSVPSSWAIGKSENGWMTGETFFEYITNVFYPWLVQKNTEFPVILYLDGHVSHLTLHLSEFCKSKKIELVALYPNATHFLQPMDVSLFHPLKVAWRKEVYKWRIENAGVRLKRENFALLLNKVLQETVKPSMLINGFRACGLFPLNPNAVNYFQIKNQASTEIHQTNAEDKTDIKRHLDYIETLISDSTLKLFLESGPIWLHEIEYLQLFNLWFQIKMKLSDDPKDKKNEEDESTNINLEDNLLETLLPENETVTFEISEAGILNKIMTEDLNKNSVPEVENHQNDQYDQYINLLEGDLNSSTLRNDGQKVGSNSERDDLEPISLNKAEKGASETESNTLQTATTEHEVSSKNTADVLAQILPNERNEAGFSHQLNISELARTETDNKSEHKETDVSSSYRDIPKDIPSPFKNNLFWPEVSKPKKKKCEKIPSVATSLEWQEYFRHKENKKMEKEQEVADRKRKRQENKEEKEKNKSAKRTLKKEKQPKENNNEAKEEEEPWFCMICEEERKENMTKCQKCSKWAHDKCAKVSKNCTKFICEVCNDIIAQ